MHQAWGLFWNPAIVTMVAEQAQELCSALFISTEDNVNVVDAVCIVYSARDTTTEGSRAQQVSACQGVAKRLKDCST